ncbi:hypothetical protein [Streptomyces lydicus]|uniref:hypothetical protein n=1 Tax=Streptomyces lydicus TaxID=47763 RepID=UPI0036E07652
MSDTAAPHRQSPSTAQSARRTRTRRAARRLALPRPQLLHGLGTDPHGPWRLCVRINRPDVPTIYPPVAEGWYFTVHALSPPDSRHKPLQVGGAVLAFGTTLALLTVLRRRGDPRRASARAALCRTRVSRAG